MMKKLLLFLLIFILSSALLISCDLFELPDGNDDGSGESSGEGSGSGSGSGNGGGLGGGIFGEGGFGEGEGEDEGGSESTFTVTFNTDGGSAVQSQKILPGGNATQPQDPTKSGYVFDCWVIETELGEMIWEFDMPITKNVTLKARWTRFLAKLNTASDTQGCECTKYKDYYAIPGDTVTVKAIPAIGYDFAGWYEGETFVSSDIEYTFSMPERHLTYTAKFTPKTEMQPFRFFASAEFCGIHGVNDKSITDVIIPDYVTYIDEFAFSDCTQLKSVTFTGNLDYINDHAFRNCTALKTLTFKGSVREICGYAFEGCTAIETVNIENIKSWCETGFDEAEANPLSVTGKFYHNGSLVTDLVIPDNTEYIQPKAFYGCHTLKTVRIGSGVMGIGGNAFALCTGITTVTIPDNVEGLGYGAFYGCTGLEYVTLSKNISYIDASLFYECTSLKSITLPDKVREIDEYAFYGCTSLKSVNIPVNVTRIRKFAFYNCTALERIDFDAKSCAKPYGAEFIFVNAGINGNGITVDIGDTVEKIPEKMFCTEEVNVNTQSQAKIKTVIIGKNVNEIGKYAFFECSTLTNIHYKGSEAQWEAIAKGFHWNYHRLPSQNYKPSLIDYNMTYNYTGD